MRPSLRLRATPLAELAFFSAAALLLVFAAAGSGSAADADAKPAAAPAAASSASPSVKPSPAFRAAMKRFLVAQNIPTQMGEQMAYSAAEQFLTPLAEGGIQITEPMQALVLDEARKDFGKRFGDVEYLTDLYAGVYAGHFSDAEIAELATFWESPVAKKLLSTTDSINETFIGRLQSDTRTQMEGFQARMEKQLKAAGILGGTP